jgi:hypothetical protein
MQIVMQLPQTAVTVVPMAGILLQSPMASTVNFAGSCAPHAPSGQKN